MRLLLQVHFNSKSLIFRSDRMGKFFVPSHFYIYFIIKFLLLIKNYNEKCNASELSAAWYYAVDYVVLNLKAHMYWMDKQIIQSKGQKNWTK